MTVGVMVHDAEFLIRLLTMIPIPFSLLHRSATESSSRNKLQIGNINEHCILPPLLQITPLPNIHRWSSAHSCIIYYYY